MCKWKGQEFPTLEVQWKLNELTGELEELPDKLDIVEFVNSYKETAFSEVLDKFLDFTKERTFYENLPRCESGEIDMSLVQDDLTALQDMNSELDEIRANYDLPETFSVKDIYDFIHKRIKNSEVIKNEDKEKKEIVEQVKQEDVPPSST